jgi:hypothetical protein
MMESSVLRVPPVYGSPAEVSVLVELALQSAVVALLDADDR